MKKTNLTSSENEIKPIGLRNNVLTQDLDKELLLYDLARDKVFCLNETSMVIWNLCDGENTVENLRRKVSSQLKTNINEELIWLTLDMLKSEQLLSNHLEVTINFNGLSRREVIKKVGLSTMVTLPFVSAVIAPNAAAAQSQSCPNIFCLCPDVNCFGDDTQASFDQTPCASPTCSNSGGVNCRCASNFFLCSSLPGFKEGRCRVV